MSRTLTDKYIKSLRPSKKVMFYRDKNLRGFAIKVMPSGHKSFIVDGRIRHGRTRRIRLGTYPTLTLKEARKRAQHVLTQMQAGIDPVEVGREGRAEAAHKRALDVAASKSLESVWEEYLEHRELKPKSVREYTYTFNSCFSDWNALPIRDITRKMVESKFHKLRKKRGRPMAQQAFRILSSVMNSAKADEVAPGERLITDNPVDVLKEKRLRRTLKPRTTSIKPDQLGGFVHNVQQVSKLTATALATKDLIMLLLLTGLRREEGLQLRWENVNYVDKYIKIEDTKNGLDHYFPLSDWVVEILANRIHGTHYKAGNPRDFDGAFTAMKIVAQADHEPQKVKLKGWVFPSEKNDGPLRSPHRHIADMRERTGIDFKIHDLRRTFTSICHAIGVDPLTTKRLINHKSRDITEGYIVTNIESLRQPAQQVAVYVKERYDKYLKAHAEKAGVGKVIDLKV